MFPYRAKYTKSEYDIQNNDLLYKIDQQFQNTFNFLYFGGKIRNISKNKILHFILCINSIIHIWENLEML